jgi:hypothetical protein
MALEETVHGGGVVVVLVLGRLLGLGLEQQGAREADVMLVLGDQGQEPSQLRFLAGEVGVEQGLVAFAAAPQHVVLSAEVVGRLHRVLDLCRGVGEHLRVGVGRGAGGVAGVREDVGCSPQQAYARRGHLGLDRFDHTVQVACRRREGVAGRGDVDVVEGEVGGPEFDEELEGGLELVQGGPHRLGVDGQPGSVERAGAEDVRTGPGEGVPVAHAEPQVVAHRLAEHHPFGVVHLESEGIVAVHACVTDGVGDLGEELARHVCTSRGYRTDPRAIGRHDRAVSVSGSKRRLAGGLAARSFRRGLVS